jgi:hypothetical protein
LEEDAVGARKSHNDGNGIMLSRSRITACIALIMSVLILYACILGVFKDSIYQDVLKAGAMTEFLIVGSRAQDMVFQPLAVLLLLLSIIYLRRPGFKLLILIIGLCSNFFYGYALYVMQGQYTSIYLVYLAIFSLSIYAIILGLLSFTGEFAVKTSLSNGLRRSISIFLYSIVFMLGLIWFIRISPDITRHIPQDSYGVFILDLGIVFPAFAISATMLMLRKPYGNLFVGVSLVKAFTVCLSWGFAELYNRVYGVVNGSYELLLIPGVITLVSLVFLILYMKDLKGNTR